MSRGRLDSPRMLGCLLQSREDRHSFLPLKLRELLLHAVAVIDDELHGLLLRVGSGE